MPVQTDADGERGIGADLDERRSEVGVVEVEIIVLDKDVGAGVVELVRPTFRPLKADAFSWATPTNTTPSRILRSARMALATSSFRWRFSNRTRGMSFSAMKSSTALQNELVILPSRAGDGTGLPRWALMKETNPCGV
jgi:hypothetical protein